MKILNPATKTESHWLFSHSEVTNSHPLGRISQSTVYQLIHVSWEPQFHSLLKYVMGTKAVALLRTEVNIYMAFLDTQNLLIYERKKRLCYWKNNYISFHQVFSKNISKCILQLSPMNGLCTKTIWVPLGTHYPRQSGMSSNCHNNSREF